MPQARSPLQNRVDPFGELHAVAERGGLMGNRGGRIHRDDRTLSGSRWKTKHWLICVCAFKGRQRDVWGQFYTELFFLDEPTALAAGHRPRFECRQKAHDAFRVAFPGHPRGGTPWTKRSIASGSRIGQVEWRARLGDLPDGAMIARAERAYAILGLPSPWSFAGHGAPEPLAPHSIADVLTPPSTVAALANGYRPLWTEALVTGKG